MMHWHPDLDKPHEHEWVYTNTYMSDWMIQAQSEVDAIPCPEGDTKECVVLTQWVGAAKWRSTDKSINVQYTYH